MLSIEQGTGNPTHPEPSLQSFRLITYNLSVIKG